MNRPPAWMRAALVACPLSAALIAGAHSPLRAAASGFQAPAPTGTGTLLVQVNPPASLYVDAKLVSADALEHRINLGEGLHRVRLIHPDYQDFLRLTTIATGQTTTLVVSLPDKGVRKPAPARGRAAAGTGSGATGRGAGAGRGSAAPSALDPSLVSGIEFVKQGDFVPAVEVLYAVTRDLSGTPRLLGQQAQAFLYLGVALLELDRLDQAKIAFALARRADKALTPRPTEFSKQVLTVWSEARTVSDDAELDDPTVATAGPVDTGEAEHPKPDAAAGDDAEFIAETETAVTFDVALPTARHPCAGRLIVDRDRRTVAWMPNAVGCTPGFEVAIDDVRSPVAAPRGGVLLQFRSGRPSLTMMPKPDVDLLEPEVDKMNVGELPPSTRVHMRRTERRLAEALGRPYDPRLNGLVVYVPIAELVENGPDYNGGIVRTSGKLAAASPTRGPYTLTDDNASVEVVPSGAAIQLLRSRSGDWINQELIVTGMFSRSPMSTGAPKGPARPAFAIAATKVEPAEGLKYKGPARTVTLEELVKDPPRGRELVRVIGKFRGTNSFGDLPLSSRREGTDWVIKDQVFSIWVTGRPAAGNGFSLSSLSSIDRDSSWVAVTGTVEERKSFVYLRAEKVELSPAPSDAAKVGAVRLQTGARNSAPDIIYTDPVQGTEELLLDSQLLLQFTKAMDETSFESHIQLRYAEGPAASFPYLSVRYYPDRNNSVIIDPGSALQRGRTLSCVLLPGIKDIDGQPLAGTDAPGGRVLTWKVAGDR
jgi:hypothetical protein